MILSLLFFETEFINIVAISYTALVLNELIMVALEITRWYASSVQPKESLLTYTPEQAYIYDPSRIGYIDTLHRQHGTPARILRYVF